jgi:hypothetical protein
LACRYRAVKGLNKGFTFALADENRFSSDVRSPKARHRRRPSQDLELERCVPCKRFVF